jgi:hypothetical protein
MPTHFEPAAPMVLHPVCHPAGGVRVVYRPGGAPNLLVECAQCGSAIVGVGVLGPKGEQLPGNVYDIGVQFHGAPYERGADAVFRGPKE